MSNETMNSDSHRLSIGKGNFAKVTMAILSFSGCLVTANCAAQGNTLPRPQISLYSINLNYGWDMGLRSGRVHMRYQLLPQGDDGSIEFQPLIAGDVDAVSNEKPKEKRQAVEQERVDSANERESLIHVLFTAAVWFVIGLAFGGAFSRPNSQSRASSSSSGEPS